MNLTGTLDDVAIADLLQFVHMGGRTGTLKVTWPDGRAQVGFHRGRIVNAVGPRSRRIGELLLLEDGAVGAEDLAAALRLQESERPRPALGQLLVRMGVTTLERITRVLEVDIASTVGDLVGIAQGTFMFNQDELQPFDDVALTPGDVLPYVRLDTQLLLSEAARVFDERNRTGAPATVLDVLDPSGAMGRDRSNGPNGAGALKRLAAGPIRLQVVSPDRQFAARLIGLLGRDDVSISTADVRDAGSAVPGEPPPIALVDIGGLGVQAGLDAVARVRRTRPRAWVVGVSEPAGHAEAYRAGALLALARTDADLRDGLRTLLDNRRDLASDQVVLEGFRGGMARLRRVFSELRSGLLTATVSLHLMSILSEAVERAVLFLVRRDDLLVLGAFGEGGGGVALANRARGLQAPASAFGPMLENLADGEPRGMAFEDAPLPVDLRALLGRPQSGQCTLFPVLGGRHLIALVYADNGSRSGAIQGVEILGLAAAQVGMAFENELLRRRRRMEGVAAEPLQPEPV